MVRHKWDPIRDEGVGLVDSKCLTASASTSNLVGVKVKAVT